PAIADFFWCRSVLASNSGPKLARVHPLRRDSSTRTNWAREVPNSKMVHTGKYPGLYLDAPATDYAGLARSQGVEGETVKILKDLEGALRRGVDKTTRENTPYVIDVKAQREGVGADSTWYQDWKM